MHTAQKLRFNSRCANAYSRRVAFARWSADTAGGLTKLLGHWQFIDMFVPSSALLGLAYLVSEVLLGISKRSQRSAASRHDRNSLRILWTIITTAIFAGVQVARHWHAAALPHPRAFAVTGALVFVAGVVLRWWAIVQLGRFFTVDVAIAADHQLIESGPYRLVRHPSYTGALLAFLGFSLSIGNWAAVITIMVPIFAAFVYRMHVEERALTSALGDSYLSYAGRTKRLIPYVY
jgi:protein-S-isoprenylcysteine O-methyltransferase Ste14